MAKRNNAETVVPMMLPNVLQPREPRLERGRRRGDRHSGEHHNGGVAEREIQPNADRPLSVLHELPGDVVDGGNVIGIDRMPQPEAVREESRAEEERLLTKDGDRPRPGRQVSPNEEDVDTNYPVAERGCRGTGPTGGSPVCHDASGCGHDRVSTRVSSRGCLSRHLRAGRCLAV